MVQLQHWRGGNDYARLSYPVVVGDGAARYNKVINRWVGNHCPGINFKTTRYQSAAACVAAFAKRCAQLKAHAPTDHFGCTLDGSTRIGVDAAGLLSLQLKTYTYTGGAHGWTQVSNLNLDLDTGQALQLKDLIVHPDNVVLRHAIEQALRASRHIAPDKTLKQAGYFKSRLPIPGAVLMLPEGLLFTYQSYAIAPYYMGQPQALVRYADIAQMLPTQGPKADLLGRLRGLHATAAK